VRVVVEYECDFEIRDYSGKTPLLYALYRVHLLELAAIVKCLIKNGADPLAVDNKGCGALHLILARLAACHNYYISPPSANMLGGILSCLLVAGCDPMLPNYAGFTPSDYALTSAGWVLWCNALRECGQDPADIIRHDDKNKKIYRPAALRFSHEKLKNASSAKVALDNWPKTPLALSGSPCSVCQRDSSWQSRPPPFDLWGSHLSTFGYVRPLHRFWLNHRDGKPCGNVYGNNSCGIAAHTLDGTRCWEWIEFSGRKHMAYELWRRGEIENPRNPRPRITEITS
jgi:hypothetical protein